MHGKPKKKRSWLFDTLLTVVLLSGAGIAAYFMLTDPDGVMDFFMGLVGQQTEGEGEPKETETDAKTPKDKPPKKKKKHDQGREKVEKPVEDKGEPISANPPPRVPTSTSAQSLALLEEARDSYRHMDYTGALGALDRMIPGTLAEREEREARRLEERSRVFKEIVADTKPLELADAKGICVLHLENGRKLEGRVIKQEGGFIYLQKNHGIKYPARAEDVDRIEKIPRSIVLKHRAAEYETIRGKKNPLTAVGVFELVEHCIREGLRDKVTGLLEKGLSLDGQFPVTVYNEKAKRVYRLFIWYKGKKKEKLATKTLKELKKSFPDSYYTTTAQEDEKAAPPRVKPPSKREPPEPDPGPEPEPEPRNPLPRSPLEGTPEPPPRPKPPVSTDSLLKTAEAAYRKAITAFEEAIALYEEAQRKYPDRAAEFEDILQDMFASLFWCKKRQTLD
jgi:hypothetical protein